MLSGNHEAILFIWPLKVGRKFSQLLLPHAGLLKGVVYLQLFN